MDLSHLGQSAFSDFRAGRLEEAGHALAEPLRIAFEGGEQALSIEELPNIVALSIAIDLAAGRTGSAERCRSLLAAWEERISNRLRLHYMGPSEKRLSLPEGKRLPTCRRHRALRLGLAVV
jgi:hypothetical protein